MDQADIRAALDRHWLASDANDSDLEHEIYAEDAVLEYPQSGERLEGRRNIEASRVAQPSASRCGASWAATTAGFTEFILTYDGRPSYTVSIMEFQDGKVARETQYTLPTRSSPDPRAQWVERMG